MCKTSQLCKLEWNRSGERVVAEVQLHQPDEVRKSGWQRARDVIVGDRDRLDQKLGVAP